MSDLSVNPMNTEELTVYRARTFFERLRGLLGRNVLTASEALHIEPCRDVHSFGMRYPLDIVFLNDTGKVVSIGRLKPNSWMKCKRAKSVLELRAGSAERYGLQVGDYLRGLNPMPIGERPEHKL